VADQTANVVAWSAGVSAASATLAGILASRATTPLSKNPWFMLCMVIAIVSFVVLLLVGFRLIWVWWRGRYRAARTTAPAPEAAAHPSSPISAASPARSEPGSAISLETSAA
jgi:hypothetical protein